METLIPPQVGMRLQTKEKKEKKKSPKKEKAQIKKWEKKREGAMLLSFYHTCASNQYHVLHIESLLSYHFHILVGIFIIELVLYIPMMGFLKCSRSSWASKLDAHPLSFFLSFHTLIALVHPLHGNPYSSRWQQLMGISIAHWLAASMWDFLLFCLLHITSTIIFYPTHSAISMAHAHVLHESWKSLRLLKYETIAWIVIGVVHD